MIGPESKPPARAARDPAGTIKRIIEAARAEFGANGFDGTRMEHIARRAGVSKQLVYLYFNGKDELYGELVKTITIASYDRLLTLNLAPLEPEAAIRLYIETIFDQFTSDPVMAMVTIDQSLHDGAQIRRSPEARRMHTILRERLRDPLERGQATGVFGRRITVEGLEFMTTIIVSGCVSSRGMFARFMGTKSEPDLPIDWRDYAVDFILRALSA